MQSAINRWEGGLKATGGAIVPEKSWVYPIAFQWDHNRCPSYKTTQQLDREVAVKDKDGQWVPLKMLEASQGMKTLGVILAPDGNNNEAVKALRKSTIQWKNCILTGHLLAREAWQCLETTIMKTIKYPLPSLTLTKKQCEYIMAPIHKAGLCAANICHKFPKALIYGDRSSLGLGQHDIYVTQGIYHVTRLINHLHDHQSITGTLLKSNVKWAKLELGISTILFSSNFNKY